MTSPDAPASLLDDPAEAPVDQSRLLRQIGYRITRAELNIHRRLMDRLAHLELRPVEYSLLVLVEDNPGINQRQIGEALGVSPSNLVGVITRLTRRHLIRRSRGRHDRRIQHLRLTDTGSKLLAQADAIVFQFNDELVSSLSRQEIRVLGVALHKACNI